MEQRNILTVGGLATLLTIFGICYGIAKYVGRMEDRVIQLERQIEELKSKVSGVQGQKGETGPEGPRGLKGDTGPEGPRGPKGDTGPEGSRGPRGETGAQGPKGDRGDSGTSSRSSNSAEVPQKASLSPSKKMSMHQLEFILDSCKREGSGYACSVVIKNLDLKSRNLWLYRDYSRYKSRLSDVNGYEYIAESIEYGADKNPKNKFMSNTLSAGMKIRAKFYFPAMPVVELDSFEFSAKAIDENHDEFQVKFDKPG